jgi:hypothetical protein
MRKIPLVLLASVLCISIFLAPVNATAAEGTGSSLVLEAGFGCKMQQGKLVCGKGQKKDDDDDDDDDDKPKAKAIPKKCGKVRCDPGYVVLEKPNKYGACCEAREGLPPPKTAEPEKCKFPGEVGTPPNCTCPSGTQFMGYKGCVKKVVQRVCCTGIHGNTSGKTTGCKDTEAEARQDVSEALINGVPVTSITCAPEKTLR